MKTMGAAKFKERCLALLDELGPEGLVITKRGKPVARVLPYDQEFASLIGSLRHKINVRGDLLSTGIKWDADAEP
ncbi:type II toxin-antitoxin system Phd/YefM family antitoxin [Candidatus Palauibacter sp.]|uniref:type II toxin-antitoxin system Phd/YefM family antitoxin n=1 Tax=Candidatus Palauibacter sp. TaxID=3101350 RepID=UPI003D11E048